jgi:hypothetical protein
VLLLGCSKQMLRWYLKIMQHHFLQDPSQFILQQCLSFSCYPSVVRGKCSDGTLKWCTTVSSKTLHNPSNTILYSIIPYVVWAANFVVECTAEYKRPNRTAAAAVVRVTIFICRDSDWLRAGRPRSRSSSPDRVMNFLHSVQMALDAT